MNVTFLPSSPSGTVAAPPSKSHAHRLLISAALAQGESRVSAVAPAQDILATLDCLSALGAEIVRTSEDVRRDEPCSSADKRGLSLQHVLRIRGFDPFAAPSATLPCRESASTLRFLLPLCLLSGQKMTLTGSPRLLARPLGVYETLCKARGFLWEKGERSLRVCGRLTPGRFSVPGGVSSQFVSGLLFALPLLSGDSTLFVEPPLVSAPYVDLTVSVLQEFGILIHKKSGNFFEIPGNQKYSARNALVEGDWSNAAPFLALRALGCDVSVTGPDPTSVQGDRVCVPYLAALSKGFAELDLADCPDLGPVLFAAAALLHGGRFTHTRRLRDKESDRAAAMQEALVLCGAELSVESDAVTVQPAALHAPAQPLSSHNDHRVAMALSLVLLRTGGTLTGADCVQKSYPDFFDDLRRLGVSITNHQPPATSC